MPRFECIAVYIMANKKRGTLYIGVTSSLSRRTHIHRNCLAEGFTKRYKLTRLVYFELHEEMTQAIHREKRLKKYTREMKIALIEKSNSEWKDLYETLME